MRSTLWWAAAGRGWPRGQAARCLTSSSSSIGCCARRPPLVAAAGRITNFADGGGGAASAETPTSDGSTAKDAAITQPAAAAAPAVSAVPYQLTQSVLPPPQLYESCAALGAAKAAAPVLKTLALGTMAGCYTAIFFGLLLTVGPNCTGIAASNPGLARYITGAIGLPFQLLTILTCGADLFTGSTALVTAAWWEGKASGRQLWRTWAVTYLGNMLGCAFGVFLLLNTGLGPQLQNGISAMSLAKVTSPLKETFVKAVLANWFVCLAIWQANAAQTLSGKFIAVLGPLSAFIAIGLEHCVANLVVIPLGIFTGVPGVTWPRFLLHNLLPVTIGNAIAGALLVATPYAFIFGSLGKRVFGGGGGSSSNGTTSAKS